MFFYAQKKERRKTPLLNNKKGLIRLKQLELLRKEFKEVGYTKSQIKEIEESVGSGSFSDRIENLEMEKSYWE